MEKAELVSKLTALIDRYAQHRQYIEKAKSQSGKFSAAVIEKVILDHEVKASNVADEVAPLLPALHDRIAALRKDRAGIEASRGGVDEQIQELDLRLAIGEMEQADYDAEVAGLKSSVESTEGRLAEIDSGLAEFTALADRWAVFFPDAVVASVPPVAADPGEADGAYGSRTDIREDMSPVFEPDVHALDHGDDEVAIETAEIAEDGSDGPSADVPFGFDDDAGDLDLVGAGDHVPSEVEIEIGGEANAPAVGGEAVSGAGEPQRRALLLYQEGTAEEQIYPFTGDQLTIGRGRENDIQIKNDSKVSRYHCKLFRRGNSFYIEDIKSSNGTLVNGELITDRRLFGGEEVIIGETFFRFRIME